MKYVHYNSEQYFFDRILHGVVLAIKCAGKTIVYFPQLFGGYCMARCLLNKETNGILWVALTVLFAIILYQCIFLLKGLLIAFKTKRNFWWLPFFILCILYTCVLPVVLFFGLLQKAAFYFTIEYANGLTWLFAIVACGYLYSKYEFLNDGAPKIALAIYKLGHSIVERI
ncbi:hypothetical protein FRZ67_19405 [Panacibacter ginsenosidivorans]|uniref:Uncharacterized protein n=1 Tax=Panacibacter ginsenosidivorans TaxID=1813871 RepID=A0A5B8VCW2_9BACT|nr:hypothetical protein [Panacibacter ginsenosidivorans]QEC69367.1 hypothetical protein FRZ67_19405 [Panacibacter ginsenosidivorans]